MISFAIHLFGAIALLLWAVRLVRTGVERGFMVQLRAGLRKAGNSGPAAGIGGAMAAFGLQSSTAVVLLVVAFIGSGALSQVAGLSLVLGADVGSALVALVLVHPVGDLIPVLICVGVPLYLKAESRTFKETGRIAIGLALVFVSLVMLRNATSPLKDSVLVEMALGYLAQDLLSGFVLGALLAWLMHSSVAAVLTLATFVGAGLLSVEAAAAIVLGANFGGALIPFALTRSAPRSARLVVLGNILLRGGGAALTVLALILFKPDLSFLGNEPLQQILFLHLGFNFSMAILAIPLIPGVLGLLDRLLPQPPAARTTSQVSALDDAALEHPDQALACAAREVLRMGEAVRGILSLSLELYRNWDPETARTITEQENRIDQMHFRTKLYIARMQQGHLNEDQSRQAMDLATFANSLEEAGDQISTNMLDFARQMRAKSTGFSENGWQELSDFHDRVLSNSQLALNVLMTQDRNSALLLVEAKDQLRQFEKTMQVSHLERLRFGNPASIETSNIHQETIRSLKQINTSFSIMAYPIAEEAGALLSSRLAGTARG